MASTKNLVENSRVAVVGGSIAGCATAIALSGLVGKITVFERSSSPTLEERGQGIGLPRPMQELLLSRGFIGPEYRFIQTHSRLWYVKDGSSWKGRQVWKQDPPVQLHNWGLLWTELRQRVSADYQNNVEVSDIVFRDSEVELKDSSNNSLGTFDFVVAADGSGSIFREMLVPDSEPQYSGYVLWRGSFPYERIQDLQDHDLFLKDKVWTTPCFQSGHGIFYVIPCKESDYFVNWAVYTHTPPGMNSDISMRVIRDIPKESLDYFFDMTHNNLPPFFSEMVARSKDNLSIHPIFDDSPDLLVHESSRMALVGDAGAFLRPHTASGTLKAFQDVMALAKLCSVKGTTWEDVCGAYQMERKSANDSLVLLGRRLGYNQVVDTPDWANMSPDDFVEWSQKSVGDTNNYMYKKSDK